MTSKDILSISIIVNPESPESKEYKYRFRGDSTSYWIVELFNIYENLICKELYISNKTNLKITKKDTYLKIINDFLRILQVPDKKSDTYRFEYANIKDIQHSIRGPDNNNSLYLKQNDTIFIKTPSFKRWKETTEKIKFYKGAESELMNIDNFVDYIKDEKLAKDINNIIKKYEGKFKYQDEIISNEIKTNPELVNKIISLEDFSHFLTNEEIFTYKQYYEIVDKDYKINGMKSKYLQDFKTLDFINKNIDYKLDETQYVKHNNHLTKSIKLTTLCIKYAYEHKNKNNKLKGLLEEYKVINYNNNSTEESKTKKQLAFEKAI
ncbi:hypothetical protein RRG52_03645 [Mycoplasmopsis cynos]|uniref:hypothetical protein n=1 Tax=Mycoplasmopsis cynos TaxID=171284 RepID=UPI002B00006B|nr:hypothetical protein [Mycoplasmopsis cynos]WQQ13565.1 hypothetical protein RRG52_02280 [Mycoplasmopsis cynos]WQQ13819.1 hypothetical protein RRG52_03645 [Mycoplasmopsis cynos]